MQALAAVMADGERPLDEVLVENVARLRRGMTAVIITPSLDRDWVRSLTGLRNRNVETAIILLDAAGVRGPRAPPRMSWTSLTPERRGQSGHNASVRHALAEHDLRWLNVEPGRAARHAARDARPAAHTGAVAMSTIETTAGRSVRPNWLDDASEEYPLPDLPFTPREGWLSVIALAVMLLAAAVAIDDAQWAGFSLGTRSSQTGFLPLAALIERVAGHATSPRHACRRWRINLIGTFAGAVALLFFVSRRPSARAPTLEARLHDLNLSV